MELNRSNSILLHNGTTLLIRPLGPADHERLAEGFHRLSIESRYRRFFTSKQSLSEREVHFFTSCDDSHHLALGVFRADCVSDLIAVARCVRDAADPTLAEVAIVVDDQWQKQGIGKALLNELATRARNAGIREWKALLLEENHAMRRLLEYVGERQKVTHSGDGTIELLVRLPPGN